MNKRVPAFSLLLVLVLSAASAVQAQPDLSGYWLIGFGAMPPVRPATPFEQSLLDTMPKGTLLLADTGLVEFAPGNYGGLKPTERALKEAAAYDIKVQVAVATTCQPPSVILSMQGPFPMEIFQGRDLIVIKMEYFDVVRIIFMNQKTHPDNWPDSVTGHSIGHWEGDTLVVDTNHISASTLLNNGMNHSNGMHLIEKFRISPDGKNLVILQEYEDPAMFAGMAARLIPLAKHNDHVYPYDCDPSYGDAIQSRDQSKVKK